VSGALEGTAGVSWSCCTIPSESGWAANPRAGTQNRTTGDGDRLFKKSLAAFQGASPAHHRPWRRRIYEEIREAGKAEAAVNRLCQAAGVSRAGYYRFRRRHESKPADMTLRNRMQHIALRWPAYGYRRVHAELISQGSAPLIVPANGCRSISQNNGTVSVWERQPIPLERRCCPQAQVNSPSSSAVSRQTIHSRASSRSQPCYRWTPLTPKRRAQIFACDGTIDPIATCT
jgi:hypothetical protein